MDHKEGAYKVKDLGLADAGRMRIEWAESRMPVLMRLREEHSKTKPFDGYKITGCLHVTKETAVLIETLKACGAEVAWSGCNPLSTNDEVAAALALGPNGTADNPDGVEIYAWYGQDTEGFYWSIDRTIDKTPDTTLDDGADLIFRVHSAFPEKAKDIIGGSEETTDRRPPPPRNGRRRQAALPRLRRQRRRDEVGFRQRLRHRAKHARRDPPRLVRPPRRQELRRRGLRGIAGAASRCAPKAWARTSSSPKSSRRPRSRRRSKGCA